MSSTDKRQSQLSERQSDRPAIASILVVLDMLAVQLSSISRDVDTSVTGVCAGFMGMGERARSALSTASHALECSSDGDGLSSLVSRVKYSLEEMLRRIESSRDFSARLSKDIGDINDRLNLMTLLSNKLGSIAEEARIAACDYQLTHHEDASNQGLVERMRDQALSLSRSATESCKAIRIIVEDIGSAIASAKKQATEKAVADSLTVSESATQVQSVLDQLTSSYEHMTRSLSKSATISSQLNLDIAQAVMALQFQDRVGQRISHILESIAELSSELRPFLSSSDETASQSITSFLLNRVVEKSTMEVERVIHHENPVAPPDECSIEFF